MRAVCLCLALLFVQPSLAADKTVSVNAGDLAKLMAETKIVAVPKPPAPVSEYKSDGDPSTLEIVFLGKNDGADHVSEDGEIIFQHADSSQESIQKLLREAFGIRAFRQGLAK